MLYEKAVHLDGCIMALVNKAKGEQSLITELVTMLLMIKDTSL